MRKRRFVELAEDLWQGLREQVDYEKRTNRSASMLKAANVAVSAYLKRCRARRPEVEKWGGQAGA